MSKKFKSFFSNSAFVVISNTYSLIISTFITFIIPSFFSQETYSYFQLENLYCGYLWIMSIGWNDGYYIKYGGCNIEKIKKDNFSSMFIFTILHCIFFLIVFSYIALQFFTDKNKKYVFILATVSVSIEVCTSSLLNLLQASFQMKKFAFILFIDRTIYSILVIFMIVFHRTDFKLLILSDIVSKIILLMICLIFSRDFFEKKISFSKEIFCKSKEIISSGFSVTIATYASKLINSITQFAIENKWGLLAFGKVALTLTISNAFSKFVNAVSLVLFPSLRNSSENTRIKVYNSLNVLLTVLMLAIFVFYLPIVWMLKLLLPNYVDSLRYIAILLPISLFETKVTMLVNTYLKVIRHEKEILFSNIIAVIISLIFAILSTVIFSDLDMTLISIVVVLSIRCYFAEYRLSKFINIKKSSFDILIMAAAFISSNWYVGGLAGTIMYIICLIIFMLINKQNLVNAKENLMILSKK